MKTPLILCILLCLIAKGYTQVRIGTVSPLSTLAVMGPVYADYGSFTVSIAASSISEQYGEGSFNHNII
ncbi:MAG TPA: hypothetical protein VNV85_17590 [Puia sp.]|jgi:hypothetical protein|nr:hypothetical protein [Puia sp.]